MKVCRSTKVFKTTDDLSKAVPCPDFLGYCGSGARLRYPPDVEMVDLTVCLRFYAFSLDGVLISSQPNPVSLMSTLFIPNFFQQFMFQGIFTPFETDWPIMTWNHMCWSFANRTSLIKMVVNGEVVTEKVDEVLEKKSATISAEFLQTLVIMRAYEPKVTPPYTVGESPSGEVV